ncbi:hypothetical protein ACC760_38525, partial [Rhizobium ruizarguesonis]
KNASTAPPIVPQTNGRRICEIWQTQRAAETLEHERRSSVELSTTLAQVKNIAASNPTAILTFQGAGEPTSLAALVAVSQIEEALSQA